ncbi:MAG: NAD-dependent epimerase/dehydratase family protein [Bacteroidia bacterium]
MKKILITGGSGFIGRYFVARFKDAEVCIFDLKEPDYPSNATWIKGDVRDKSALFSASDGCDAIVHLAAMHHDFGISDQEYFDTNVAGAQNVVDAAVKNSISIILNFSSVAVYGKAGNPGPTNENTPAQPENAYGKSKLEAERIFTNWCSTNGYRRLIQVRSTVVFGAHNLANVLSLIKVIDRGLYLHTGLGDNIKSLAYVENLVDACFFALNASPSGELLFNYVDYPQKTSRQIALLQAQLLGKKIRWAVPHRLALLLSKPFDWAITLSGKNLPISSKRIMKLNTQTCHGADKIRNLGFTQQYSIEKGMERMISWYRKSI